MTKRLLLLSTIHVLYGPWHPMHLARFAATADHISKGRFGVNVVTGFNPAEPRMFGMQRMDHDLRYDMAGEFVAIMKLLWRSEQNLTHHGRFWQLDDAFVRPKPRYGRPILVNATGSPAGFSFDHRACGRHPTVAADCGNPIVATRDDVIAVLQGERKAHLVCFLRPDEYAGVTSVRARPGHIPGSVNLPFVNLLDDDNTFKSVPQLRAQFAGVIGGAPMRVPLSGK